MAIGRISGQMLKSNLVRDGVDLAFETDLLYLDVVNSRIGVNKSSPLHDLDVNGTTKSTDLEVTNQFDIGNITVTGNTISSDLSTITFAPSGAEPTIYNARLVVDDIQILGNTISTEVSNSALELRANGTGIIDIYGNTNITGKFIFVASGDYIKRQHTSYGYAGAQGAGIGMFNTSNHNSQ